MADALEFTIAERTVVNTGEVADAVAFQHLGVVDFDRRPHDRQLAIAFVEPAVSGVTDLRAGHAHMRQLLRELVRQPAVVAVEERHICAGGGFDACVARSGNATVARHADRYQSRFARGRGLDDVPARVLRSVVDHQQFNISVALREHRIH